MTRILVVGGGIAGVVAAISAASSTSRVDVTLLEASDTIGLNKSLLPSLLSGSRNADGEMDESLAERPERLEGLGVRVRLGETAARIDAGSRFVATGRGERLSFDRLILATGSRTLPPAIPGASKKGVFVMTGVDEYRALSGALPEMAGLVLVGSSPLTLSVASILSARRRSSSDRPRLVTFLGTRGLARFSGGVQRRILEGAASRGVRLVSENVETVVGIRRVEAVISRGVVEPCDGVLLFPSSAPNVPDVECRRGTVGGVLVDLAMRTSVAGVLAAGDCVEIRGGIGPGDKSPVRIVSQSSRHGLLSPLTHRTMPFRLQSAAVVMGNVAGHNAAHSNSGGDWEGADDVEEDEDPGALLRARISGTVALELFGLPVCTCGIDNVEADRMGLGAVEVDLEIDRQIGESGIVPDSDSDAAATVNAACTATRESHVRPVGRAVTKKTAPGGLSTCLIFDRVTHIVLGIQLAGDGALSLAECISTVICSNLTLEDLAYQEVGYLPGSSGDDPAPLRTAARKALGCKVEGGF